MLGRALPNTKTNVIEAGPGMELHEEKDWYYNIEKENDKPERCGPVTFSDVRFFLYYGNSIDLIFFFDF